MEREKFIAYQSEWVNKVEILEFLLRGMGERRREVKTRTIEFQFQSFACLAFDSILQHPIWKFSDFSCAPRTSISDDTDDDVKAQEIGELKSNVE